MPLQIENVYYVGKDQPYATVNQAINTIASAINTNNYTLPSSQADDGGQVNVVIVGNGKFPPITIPDNLTPPLRDAGRYLVIKRQESKENGSTVTNALPVITPMSQNGSEIQTQDKLIGINIGSNNPNVKIVGLRVSGFVIGAVAGFNSDNLYINRCFLTNSINAQLYAYNLDNIYLTNSVLVGGQYGAVLKQIKNPRVYHNTIIVDGASALDQITKAGLLIQGERLFGNTSPGTIYCLGNVVYTRGCPAGIFYDEDLKNNRIVSDYNDWYSQDTVIQLRQDNATLPNESEVVKHDYISLLEWRSAGPLGTSSRFIDQNSISLNPQFIQNISLVTNTLSSIINLGTIDNAPIMQKVPAWYYTADSFYTPSDFDTTLISVDSLLNTRQQPLTSIGANDKASVNGFFGQDIFTSPLDLDPEKKCSLDPLSVLASQELVMTYPAIKAGHFWSHDRPYYLYGKKFAAPLGYIARTKFRLPGYLDASSVKVLVLDKELPGDWDLIGQDIFIYHKDYGITSYDNEVQISGRIKRWYQDGFAFENAYYIFKISDGITEFILPSNYQSNAPVVITDDRIGYLNPSDATRSEFRVDFDGTHNKITFGGNENLFDNSDFSFFTSGNIPGNWVCPRQTGQSGVFMLWNQYAYFGDYAVGLKIDGTPNYLSSKRIPISEDEEASITWHARLASDITGSDGLAVASGTGAYQINFYDNYDELMTYSVTGNFVASTDTFTRFYIPLGASDSVVNNNLHGLDSAPLSYISTTPYQLPANVTKFEFTLSGTYNQVTPGAFLIIDAVQAERNITPSYYHPKPHFTTMTIECETDQSGIFTDSRMNISSIMNENPNGFVTIADMPASLWGGPMEPEVTTLHEYRWPHGRINVLPWARLFGKDKLQQKVILSNKPAYLADVIKPYIFPRGAATAVLTPSVLYCNQDAIDPEGFHIQILDSINNPYSLRNYVAHVYDEKHKFPGWLSKRYYGAKEQLGSTIYGKLNNNGSLSASYLSPSSNHIRWVGAVPSTIATNSGISGTVDTIASINTSYNCSLTSNANITIIGQSGMFHNVNSSSYLSGAFYTEANSNSSYIGLQYPPVFGSVELSIDGTNYKETQGIPQSNEFYVDYLAAQLKLSLAVQAGNQAVVSYKPRYAYPDINNPDRIIMHTNQIFGSYTGPIQVDYDAEVKLEIRVSDPLNREFVATFPVVLQNPQLGYIEETLSSFEF